MKLMKLRPLLTGDLKEVQPGVLGFSDSLKVFYYLHRQLIAPPLFYYRTSSVFSNICDLKEAPQGECDFIVMLWSCLIGTEVSVSVSKYSRHLIPSCGLYSS